MGNGAKEALVLQAKVSGWYFSFYYGAEYRSFHFLYLKEEICYFIVFNFRISTVVIENFS